MLTAADLFAGAGGSTTGAEMAGLRVVAACNHWRTAIDTHARNHPGVEHFCQDLSQMSFLDFPRHDILMASPACQGHSRARGKEQPHHDGMRSTAWAVVTALDVMRQRKCPPVAVVVENVVDFRKWVLYQSWVGALRQLGYSVADYALDAADFGVPQHRERMFFIATRSKAPLILDWPDERHVPISSVLRFDEGPWASIEGRARPLKAETHGQVKTGRRLYGDRFLIPYYGEDRRRGNARSIERPLGTVTTRERYALVDGDRMRMLTVKELRAAMGFPEGYWLPSTRKEAVHLLGNAVCPPVIKGVLDRVIARL